MNRKLLVVVIVAAVLALVVGAAVGRNLISSATPLPRAEVVRFQDEISKVSIAYPASWKLLPLPSQEPDVALRIALEGSAAMQMRSTQVGIEGVTKKTLPVVRKFTDGLLNEDPRVRLLDPPLPVELGGVPGYRYRYRYTVDSSANAGAHLHYFLFKGTRMIQLVFETATKARLMELTPAFQKIAATFKSEDG